MIVRPLTIRDAAEAAGLEARAFTDPWPAASFAALLPQPHVVALGAVDDAGALAGYAIGTVAADEGEVLNLAVREESQRQGLGRELTTRLLEQLESRGARSFYLEVRESNGAAIALYGVLGFTPLGRRKGYYRAPREDAVTMVKGVLKRAEK